MQRLFEPVKDQIRRFIQQRDDLGLVVRVTAIESAYVLKLLQSLDEGELPDMFWTFADPFESAPAFVNAVVCGFQARFEAARTAMREQKLPPWPDLPAPVLEAARDPVTRMRELMIFARSLIPSTEGMNLVWVLFPMRVDAPLDYARFVAELICHEPPIVWCHHMRLVLRDPAEMPALVPRLRQARRLQWMAPDLSTKAMEHAIEEDAEDPALPVAQRVMALLQLAILDSSYRRYLESLEKLAVVLEYYMGTGDHTMIALTMNSIGEAYDRSGNTRRAQESFESALTPAAAGKAYPVLLNVLLNLGNLHLAQKRWAQAEGYYVSGAELARALRNPHVLIRCLENVGTCRHAQGDLRGAFERWNEAATLARSTEEHQLLYEVLERLRALYASGAMRDRRVEVEREMARLEAFLPKQLHAGRA